MEKSRSILLIPVLAGLCLMRGASYPEGEEPPVITITAKRFAFTPAQITLKKGETVKLQLTSQDVTHGFFMTEPRINEVITPEETKEVTITPQIPGTFTVVCNHTCGVDHANMQMTVVVE